MSEPSLKQKTARTLKWNTIDRVGSQVLYAVVGVVLANVLSKEDFGLVGALLVFQAFANLFVDSGFGAALLQRKEPTEEDYSTVFWFNLAVSILVYVVLFLAAPLIAYIFQGDERLIPLSRVMFLSFILNGLGMVQTTRLMKRMSVQMIAVANMLALVISGALGIYLALSGYGAWALVWQTVTLCAVKSGWLWITGHWHPTSGFKMESLKKMWRVGLSVFSTSSLNTFFLYIYSFVIGAFYNLTSLGVYTQADKWSKMGSASISQVLTASFVPVLSRVQDDGPNFRRYMTRVNRFTGFILFPVMIGIAAIGEPLFHLLFGTKWDDAVPLFQILTIRGIFVVLISLYNNYLLALGYGKRMVSVEVVKDVMIFVAILATMWMHSVEMLVWGQLAASLITWSVVIGITCRATGYRTADMLRDLAPFALIAILMGIAALFMLPVTASPILQLLLMVCVGIIVYVALARLFRLPELTEAIAYLRRKSN
jgi:O-antigen/teichoic acid export membrane protein